MKTIVKIIVIMGLSFQLSAQDVSNKIFNNKKQAVVKIDSSVNLFKSLDFLIAPQFGGLFTESFKNVKGISNLKMFYNDFDLGLKLGFKYEIINRLILSSFYNIGLVKFNQNQTNTIESAFMKVAVRYNF